MKILILNGPNLNLLGKREPEIYGSETLEDLINQIKNNFPKIEFSDYQSNHEGQLIDRLHQQDFDAVVFNPAAYSHTSIALLDAIQAIKAPVIEVHISDISKREAFRKKTFTSLAAVELISGKGRNGYILAVESLIKNYISNVK